MECLDHLVHQDPWEHKDLLDLMESQEHQD